MTEKKEKKIEHTHPADIADIMRVLRNEKERLALFYSLDHETAALTLRELDPINEANLIEDLPEEYLSDLIDQLPADDATDIIAGLPLKKQESILRKMHLSESREIKKLLQYKEDSAGGIMTTDFISLQQDMSIEDAFKAIKKKGDEDNIPFVFVTDPDQKFVGSISKNHLISNPPEKILREIDIDETMKVLPDIDQEEVAKIFSKYNLVSLPVVTSENKMIGVITVDDVIDVIEEEATEDIYKFAGIDEDELLKNSAFKIAQIRLPWLLTTLVGGIISCVLIRVYQFAIEETIALAFFIPVITGMGGNIGIQSSTIVIRGLATGRILDSQIWLTILREVRIGALMGLVCGTLVGTIALYLERTIALGCVVGISMFAAIIVAAIMGSLVPMTFRRLKIDPAVSSGPFITTANDITGLIIYFSLANILLKVLK